MRTIPANFLGGSPKQAHLTLVLWIGWSWCRAYADSYKFVQEPVSGARTLRSKYLFYVYAVAESPGAETLRKPQATFEDLTVRSRSGRVLPEQTHVKVGLIPYSNFSNYLQQEKLCHYTGGLMQGIQGAKLVEVQSQPRTVAWTLPKTSMYLLVVSNCGDLNDLVISGKVRVRNPYGYLPGIEYPKIQLYGWMSLAYILLMACWFFALSSKGDKFYVHRLLTITVLLGVAECGSWWIALHVWNGFGKNMYLVLLAEALSVAKSMCGLSTLILLSQGLGIVQVKLQYRKCFIAVLSLYWPCAVLKNFVLFLHHHHNLRSRILILGTMPFTFIVAFIFCWIFWSLADTMQKLWEAGSDDQEQRYNGLWLVTITSMLISTLVLGMQLMQKPGKSTLDWWSYQLVWNDAVPAFVFFCCLALTLSFWVPQPGTYMLGFSHLAEEEGLVDIMPTGADALDLPCSQKIGAGQADQEETVEKA